MSDDFIYLINIDLYIKNICNLFEINHLILHKLYNNIIML